MKTIILLATFFLCFRVFGYDGCACGEVSYYNHRMTKTVEKEYLVQAAKNQTDPVFRFTLACPTGVSIDHNYVIRKVEEMIPEGDENRGRIGEVINHAMELSLDALQAGIDKAVENASASIRREISRELDRLGIDLVYEADNDWKKNCCDEGSWSGANIYVVGQGPQGSSFTVDANAGFEWTVGVNFIKKFDVPFHLRIANSASFSVVNIGNIEPQGTVKGSVISIRGTPQTSWSASAEISARIGITLGQRRANSDNGVLRREEAKLKCNDSLPPPQ